MNAQGTAKAAAPKHEELEPNGGSWYHPRDMDPSLSASVVAVFAHPDDDLVIGPLLAHQALGGSAVTVVCATSGQRGTANTAIPAGSELGAAREEELRAACRAYGVRPPILLGFQDGELDSLTQDQATRLDALLRQTLESLGPSVVITFGPDGYTGHPDHIAIGGVTTRLVAEWHAADSPPAPRKLYHVMCPTSVAKRLPPGLRWFVPVDDAEATTIVDARDGIEAACAAASAYVTQFTPQTMAQINELFRNIMGGRVYLRSAQRRPGGHLRVETEILA